MAREKKASDGSLIAQIKSGSSDAFEELLGRYESKVYNLALRFTRNQEDAEEVLQDVFVTVFKKVGGFEGKAAFSSWLYRVIVNSAFMKLRKRKHGAAVSIEDVPEQARTSSIDAESIRQERSDAVLQNRQLQEVLNAAILRLPDQYRAVFVLRDIDGLSNSEVGEILSISIPAVKSRLHRSRLMLRRKLQRMFDDYTGKRMAVPEDMEFLLAAN
jgi:RNA polymerase sigma-70 factor (ECF subfamily)